MSKTLRNRAMLAMFGAAALATSAGGENLAEAWPQFRGSGGLGRAAGSHPVEWTQEKNVRWSIEVPGLGLCLRYRDR